MFMTLLSLLASNQSKKINKFNSFIYAIISIISFYGQQCPRVAVISDYDGRKIKRNELEIYQTWNWLFKGSDEVFHNGNVC